MRKIGFVDDERQILKSLKRMFFKTKYEGVYFNSAKELLNYLKVEKLDLVITDIRMPEIDGIKLMKILSRNYPNLTIIAISGYSDTENILRAIDINLAKFYLQKPWNKEELISLIDSIFYMKDIFNQKNLTDQLIYFDSIPISSRALYKTMDMIERDMPLKDISCEVEKNPILSTHLLRIVNAANHRVKLGSIQDLMTYLGRKNIKHIKNIIQGNLTLPVGEVPKESQILFLHSQVTNALTAQIYSELRGGNIPQKYSSAGLLHNIGLIALKTTQEESYRRVEALYYKDKEKNNIEYYEEKVLGINHMELGAYLLDWWNFPDFLAEVSYKYRYPEEKHILNREIVRIIHVASYFSWEFIGEDRYKSKLDRNSLGHLNIEESRIREMLDRIINSINNQGEYLCI